MMIASSAHTPEARGALDFQLPERAPFCTAMYSARLSDCAVEWVQIRPSPRGFA
jgi:hypothetical protein